MDEFEKMKNKLEQARKKIRILEDMIENNARELYTYNQELKAKNHEKDILLKEIHHRVKNNLQIITSLLSIQSAFIEDEFLKSIFGNSQRRITSMALVHEMLYQTENLSKINYKTYIDDLTNSIYNSFSKPEKISIETDCEEIYLSIETAVPLGLIINEIVTNSFKHAFNGIENGKISIYLKHHSEEENSFLLSIKDNGIGFMENSKSKSLGLKLIKNLSRQLDAYIERNTEQQGTHYNIQFKELKSSPL